MIRCALLTASLIIICGSISPGRVAAASLFGSEGLDRGWCDKPSPRQTVVYIDDMMMVSGRTDWALKLSSKLRASLSPGEHVTVVRLSPGSGQSKEAWEGCWPGLTAEERARPSGSSFTSFFTRDTTSRLEEQQKFFIRDFGGVLTSIYADAKRPASEVQIDPAHPPNKEIIRALASDEARFSQSKTTVRAVIYSDMAENGSLASVFKPQAGPPENFGKRLGSYLRQSVVYAFGIGETVKEAAIAEDTRRFWTNVLTSMNAAVGGLGADLNVPNVIPVRSYVYAVTLSREGQEFDGRLALLTDADGSLTDSWLGISRLSIAELSGRFRCQRTDHDENCHLEATTNGGVATMAPSETLSLSGTQSAEMTGQLGVKGAFFPVKAKASDQ